MADLIANNKDPQPDLTKIYDQLCQSYRAIDDFRAKLMGFLPLATAGGAFLLLNGVFAEEAKRTVIIPFLKPLGFFGFVITLGLFFYELYGVRKCRNLIEAGKELERSMGIRNGQFQTRPTFTLFVVNEPFAAGIIYSAVLSSWIFLALVCQERELQEPKLVVEPALSTAIWIFSVSFSLTFLYVLSLSTGIDKLIWERQWKLIWKKIWKKKSSVN